MPEENENGTNGKQVGLLDKVKTSIKAGGGPFQNHNRSGLKVKAGIKAGAMMCKQNHNVRMSLA